jgi:hypothetical protein
VDIPDTHPQAVCPRSGDIPERSGTRGCLTGGEYFGVVRGENRWDIRARRVDRLDESREPSAHDEDVAGLDVARVPVGVRRAPRGHYGRACSRDDDFLTEAEAEFSVEHVPRFIVRMVDVEGGDPMVTDLGGPLDQHEVIARHTGSLSCKLLDPDHSKQYGDASIPRVTFPNTGAGDALCREGLWQHCDQVLAVHDQEGGGCQGADGGGDRSFLQAVGAST